MEFSSVTKGILLPGFINSVPTPPRLCPLACSLVAPLQLSRACQIFPRATSCSLECLVKAAALPFLNEYGHRWSSVRDMYI